MLELKKCRQIKNKITKANADSRKIIVDLSEHPFCTVIVSHGDGKSWGYFFNGKEQCFLGRANQEMIDVLIEFGEHSARNAEIKVIHDNPEVRRVYAEYIGYVAKSCYWYGTADRFRCCFVMNPVLFANLADCDAFSGMHTWRKKYELTCNIGWYCDSEGIDYTKALIKDAFNLPISWVKLLYEREISIKNVLKFKKYNYTPEEVNNFGWDVANVPEFLIPNKKLTSKYCYVWNYRDYINMRSQLPQEAQVHFPVNPQDVEKYHDRINVVFGRMQAQIKEKQLEEQQKKYEESFYKDASKYDYSDEEYSIIACKKLVDLVFEGNVLNHCVGSYVNSVSKGNEYILFLRKNSDIETPYFTIDLTPDHRVRQIHGKSNCNMNGAIKPFVEAWAKKFELNLNGCSGVRCALS